MHELSMALSIVDGALEELERRGLKHASAIYLRLGRLAGVDKDALQFSYNVASQGPSGRIKAGDRRDRCCDLLSGLQG
jgi:hydrogenase nickel incorporation protein HypA/HybF